MRKQRFALIMCLIMTAVLTLSACGDRIHASQPAPQDSKTTEEGRNPCPAIPAEKYPKVDGSTATLPLSYALYQAATGADEETAMETIQHNKTDSSYSQLANNRCDLVLAYEPSEETRKYIDKEAHLQMKSIGRDALVFMINASNPVKSLTEEQIQSVYTGEITNWKDLGGNDEEIVAFQRKQNSGSQTLMEKLVMKGIPMAKAPGYYYISDMNGLLESVSSYNNQGNAIGYSVYFYARNMYSLPELEFLSVDGIMPSNSTIQDGSYPYVNDFYAVIRDDEPEDSPARLLFDWLTSEGGQELIAETGYVPVLDNSSAVREAEALVMTEKGETSYDLREDQVILLNGTSWFNSPDVYIMNADMTQRDILEGYSLTGKKDLVLWSINDPLILMDNTTGKKCLYDIGKEKWIFEPDDIFINRNSNGDYECRQSGQPTRIYNGSEILQIENDFFCADEYYWIKDDTGYSIQKGGKEVSGHVDVEDPEQSRVHSGPHKNTVILVSETGEDCVYTLDGELLFKPEYLQSEFENWEDLTYYVSGCTNTKGLLSIVIEKDDTKEFWVYDIETGDYVWMEDEINTILCNKEGDYAYQIESESGLKILTDSLEPLRAPDGTPYEYCFGMDCYGYRDPGSDNIVVENPDGSIHFEMPYHEEGSEERQGTMIARGVILYTNHDQEDSLYELTSYGNPLCSSDTYSQYSFSNAPGDLSSINQEYTVLRIGEKIFVIQTDTGEVTYQSSEDSLRAKDGPVLVFRSGNWLNFRDPNGNLVMRIFADQNSGD